MVHASKEFIRTAQISSYMTGNQKLTVTDHSMAKQKLHVCRDIKMIIILKMHNVALES